MRATRSSRACRLATALAALAVLGAFGASSASAEVIAYAEPTYTKTPKNNTFHYQWQAFDGWNGSNGTNNFTYYLCAATRENGAPYENHNGGGGPGSTNCTPPLRSATGAGQNRGTYSWQPGNLTTVLADGASYQMCSDGYLYYGFYWARDNTSTRECTSTVIDRNKPVIGVSVNGTDTHTRNPKLNLYIGYQDAVSPPWFGPNGIASNWTCVSRGAPCTPQNFDPDCSVRNASGRVNGFNCQADVSAVGDGTWYFCAKSADAAVPDVAPGVAVNSSGANISDVVCGHVTLDRAAPTINVTSSTTTATVGQLVSFSAGASDPAGVTGQFDWDFGDNTARGSGASTTHTYTAPGTYQVKVKTADTLGNEGIATRTIQVNPPSGGGGGGETPPPNGGGGGETPPPNGGGGGETPPPNNGGGETPPPNNGGETPPANNGGDQTPPPDNNTGDNGSTGVTPGNQQQVTPDVVAQMNGSNGAQQQAVGGLGVIAPKTIKVAKAKSLVLALTPESPGKAEVALLKGSKIVAKKGATFSAAGTYSLKLKLPKGLKSGGYAIKVSYTAQGASKAETKSLKVKVVAAKKSAKRKKAVAPKLEGVGGNGKEQKARGLERHVKVIR